MLLEYPVIEATRNVLYLSRLDPKKNVEGLLRAFAILRRRRGNVVLLIAGAGRARYVASLMALSASLGIKRDVIWLDHVEGARKAASFAAAHVFVLPSFSENFGIAAVEAMHAGLPCVLGEGVAVARDVEKEGAGLSVAPEPAAIAEALERLLGDEDLRNEMGSKGKELAMREYSAQSMARRLIILYEEIYAAHKSAIA